MRQETEWRPTILLTVGVLLLGLLIAGWMILDSRPHPPLGAGTPGPPDGGLSRAEAVAAAQIADDRPELRVNGASAGPAGVLHTQTGASLDGVPSENTWVWVVRLSSGGPPMGQYGSRVVIDYLDGTIYSVQKYIS